MAKRSPASPMLCEKYKSGCALGLINICRVYSNKKLISDRKILNRQAVGNVYTRNKLNFPSHLDDNCKCINDQNANKSLTVDSGEANNVKVLEADMTSKLQIKKKIASAEIKYKHSNSELVDDLKKNHRKSSQTCPRPFSSGCRDIAVVEHIQTSHQNAVGKSVTKHDFVKNGRDDSHIQKRINSIDHDKSVQSNDAFEASVNQNLIGERYLIGGEFSNQSKQFSDALEILNSNKEIFLQLLQDPNSLLVKHIQDLQVFQEAKSKLSDARECEKPVFTQKFKKQNVHSIFFEKIMFRNRHVSKGINDCQNLNEIVVLKPGLTSIQNCGDRNGHCSNSQPHLGKEGQGVRPPIFSFGGIKRNLRNAIGVSKKLEHQISIDDTSYTSSSDHLTSEEVDKVVDTEHFGRRSSNEICLDKLHTASIDLNMSDKIRRPKDFESSIGHVAPSANDSGRRRNSFTVEHHKRSESNIYGAERSHLCEMLSNRNGSQQQWSIKELSKAWERTLYLSEYSFSNAIEKERQRRIGAMVQKIEKFSDHLKVYGSTQNKSDILSPDTEVHCCVPDSLSAKGFAILESKDNYHPEDIEGSSEQHRIFNTAATAGTNTANAREEENEYLECLRLNQATESPLDCSSSSHDIAEHPSPVSVLDQFLVEDDPSPSNARSRPASAAEPSPQSPQINEPGSTFQYVRKVLQAANLNWEALSVICRDSSLFIDFLNEIILEVYNSYFSNLPWLSCMKPNIQPLSLEKYVVHEMMKCVDWHLVHQPLPLTLEHLVEKDLARSRTWMDIRNDGEGIVVVMVESVLDELIEESTILLRM